MNPRIRNGELQLEDIAAQPPARDLNFKLAHVGLENVQMQVLREGQRLPARGQAGVSLIDGGSRGIHMSRLFKILSQIGESELSWSLLSDSLNLMLESHARLSDRAQLEIFFELPLLRPALLSREKGWRVYPVRHRLKAESDKARVYTLVVQVLYSSTCPCSATLSRQAWTDRFVSDFRDADLTQDQVMEWLEQNTVAIPHAQRSEAICELSFATVEDAGRVSPSDWIDVIEKALGTPVQAAVKREDELEFARLNAENLMFCEDAARKLKAALNQRPELCDFQIEVRHFESLHPHDVVARVSKRDEIIPDSW